MLLPKFLKDNFLLSLVTMGITPPYLYAKPYTPCMSSLMSAFYDSLSTLSQDITIHHKDLRNGIVEA